MNQSWESSVFVITEAPGKDRPVLSLYGLCQEAPSFPLMKGTRTPTIKTPTQIHSNNISIAHFEQLNRVQ